MITDDEGHQLDEHSRAIEHLKTTLTEQTRKDAVTVKVPVSWYLHQLLEMSQGAKKPWYTYSELYVRCMEEGSVSGFKDVGLVVTYFHSLGLLIHHCEAVEHKEDSVCLVFTDPSYLFKKVSKLYEVQFKKDVTGRDLLMLKHKGQLTKGALQELDVKNDHDHFMNLDHDHFMDLLVQLFIGAEIKSHVPKAGTILFVPSVLTNPPAAADVAPSEEQSQCFSITFKDKEFIPCGVFTGMIARLQNNKNWEICTNSISRTLMTFCVALGTVKLMDCATYINVEFDDNEEFKDEQCQEYRDTIINATTDSYCFLFHSKAAKDPQNGICHRCIDSLVLGMTCHRCPPQPGDTRRMHNYVKLWVKNFEPKSVSCTKCSSSSGAPLRPMSFFLT